MVAPPVVTSTAMTGNATGREAGRDRQASRRCSLFHHWRDFVEVITRDEVRMIAGKIRELQNDLEYLRRADRSITDVQVAAEIGRLGPAIDELSRLMDHINNDLIVDLIQRGAG